MEKNQLLAIINKLRDESSANYKARIPEATIDNMSVVGTLLGGDTYVAERNEFITALFTKVALTKIKQFDVENPLKALFNKGKLPVGDKIESIYVGMAKAKAFDPDGKDNMKKLVPFVKAYYSAVVRADTYGQSIDKTDITNAFMSEKNLQDFIGAIINSVYAGYEDDSFAIMKQVIASYGDTIQDIEVAEPIDKTTGEDFLIALRSASKDMTYTSTNYNPFGLKMNTKLPKQVILINYRVTNVVSVKTIANLFNINEANIPGTIIEVNDFGDLKDTYAMIVDRDLFNMWDIDSGGDQDHNGRGRFDNLWYHAHEKYMIDPFNQAVRLCAVGAGKYHFSRDNIAGLEGYSDVSGNVNIEIKKVTRDGKDILTSEFKKGDIVVLGITPLTDASASGLSDGTWDISSINGTGIDKYKSLFLDVAPELPSTMLKGTEYLTSITLNGANEPEDAQDKTYYFHMQ